MPLVLPNQGEAILLAYLVGSGTPENLVMRLFTSDVTVGLTDAQIDALDETDFTEAAFTGYSPVTLTGGSWTVTEGDPSEATSPAQSFTSSADQTPEDIYGYYLTRATSGDLVWFELFPSIITVEFTSDEIQVTPRITVDDTGGSSVNIGTIVMTGRATAPDEWLMCDGSAVSRTTYASLFDAIGTSYGSGDGSSTFNVPDLTQRFPLGLATSGTGSTLGDTGGSIDHTHGLDTASSGANVTFASTGSPAGFIDRKSLSAWTATHQLGTGGASSSGSFTGGAALQGDSDTANPPYTVVNFMIYAGV